MRVSASIATTAVLMVAGASALSQTQQTTRSNLPSEALKAYLRDHISLGGKIPPDTTTRINVSKVKTNSGTETDIVYVSGEQWCGSGGCTLLILEPTASTFKVLGRVTIVQVPIRVLSSAHSGHPDIGVTVRGGGILPGYEAVLTFNAKRYPGNPSMPPARKTTAVRGKVIIADTEDSVPLYD